MTTQTAHAASPFLSAPSYEEPSGSPPDELSEALALEMTSPFLRLYQSGTGDPVDPEGEALVELVTDLYDSEFEEDLAEVVREARARQRELFLGEVPSPEAEARFFDEHFEPLIREVEGLTETMATVFERAHPAHVTEAEIAAALDSYVPEVPLSPSFEHLFGGWKKKLRKLANKAKGLVKKGLKKVGRLALGPLFRRLRKLVRPLLQEVLKRAIHRLPSQYRPLARKLAKRFGLLREAETELDETRVPDLALAQLELDTALARQLLDEEPTLPREAEAGPTAGAPPLEIARERFVDQLLELEEGDDPTPHVEQFATAVLTGLRIAIRVIGRPRVVRFLSEQVAKLIGKLVGKNLARPLAQVLVDSGLRLVNLEATSEDERRAAGAAVAATVEETVRRVAELPASVLDDREMLEASVVEAFEKAARSSLPPILSDEAYRERPDLRETSGPTGAWILQPLRGPKLYKKYTQVFRRRLSPQTLRALSTWNGRSVAGLLKEHLAAAPGEEIDARVHLYEALPGTLLPEIADLESSLPGMAAGGCRNCSTLHPLTRRAAAALTGQPGLARPVARRYRTSPRMTLPGQRFFFLELPAGSTPPAADPREARCSLLKLRLDLAASRVALRLYLGETRAQEIAALLRSRTPGAAAAAVAGLFRKPLAGVLEGDAYGRARIVSGAVSPPLAPGPLLRDLTPSLRESLRSRLLDQLVAGLAAYFRTRAREFLDAVEDPRPGVTLTLRATDPALLAPLRAALEPGAAHRNGGGTSGEPVEPPTVTSVPGYHRG
ncbi:MAG: hypothetical protein R3325_04060 [Thermoanaerobaculia bacterium]|nr:hypothetical protein [Thermoanaerobaculia bacterium]